MNVDWRARGAAWILAGMALAAAAAGCGRMRVLPESPDTGKLADGTYTGKYWHGPNRAVVKVTIEQGRIAKVELVSHLASWRGRKADAAIVQRIVEKQSARVDAVTGATHSSMVIMNAAQAALDQAIGAGRSPQGDGQ